MTGQNPRHPRERQLHKPIHHDELPMRATIFLQGLDLLLYDLILADYYYFDSLWTVLILNYKKSVFPFTKTVLVEDSQRYFGHSTFLQAQKYHYLVMTDVKCGGCVTTYIMCGKSFNLCDDYARDIFILLYSEPMQIVCMQRIE